MKSRTKSLFHLTESLENLFGILDQGFCPRYSNEYIGWVAPGTEFIGIPMVCFCDIPISRLTDHTEFYGKFGIGMNQEWGVKSGLNPVMYISKESYLFKPLQSLFKNPNPNIDDSKVHVMKTLSYTKSLSGKINRKNVIKEKDFYLECEWRFVAEIYDDEKYAFLCDPRESEDPAIVTEANAEKRKNSTLQFKISDIRYLMVEKMSDIPALVDFINTKLGHCSLNDLKILSTKIISLDELIHDI